MIDVIDVKVEVLEILRIYPAIPYSIIASKVGVTRERVRQIARQNGYPLRKGVLKPKICPLCGETFYKQNRIYCSLTCSNKARRRRITINCHRCGKPIERTRGTMRNKSGRYYCNKACYGNKAGMLTRTDPGEI